MITYALEKEVEGDLWDIWISVYPKFTTDTFITFNDFKKEHMKLGIKKPMKSNEEIMDEMLKAVEYFEEQQRRDKA